MESYKMFTVPFSWYMMYAKALEYQVIHSHESNQPKKKDKTVRKIADKKRINYTEINRNKINIGTFRFHLDSKYFRTKKRRKNNIYLRSLSAIVCSKITV